MSPRPNGLQQRVSTRRSAARERELVAELLVHLTRDHAAHSIQRASEQLRISALDVRLDRYEARSVDLD